MNPYRLKDVFNYLTSNNQLLKRKLKLGTSEIPIPPKKDSITTIEAINRFNKANPRVDTTSLKPLSVKQSNVKQSNVDQSDEGVIQGAFDTATREAQSEGFPAPKYEAFKKRYLRKNMKADGGRIGYKYGTVPGEGNSKINYDPETDTYRKRVQETIDGKKTNKYIYSKPGDSLEDFKQIKPVRSTGADDATVKARQYVDNWTKDWFDNNLKKYSINNFNAMMDDLSSAWQLQLESGDVPKASGKFNFSTPELKLPNVTTLADAKIKPNLTPFQYNDITFYKNLESTDELKNKTLAQFKKVFYKNQINNNPSLQKDLTKFFNFMSSDKRGQYKKLDGKTIKDFMNTEVSDEVKFLLDPEISGLDKASKKEVFNSYSDFADNYNKYTEDKVRLKAVQAETEAIAKVGKKTADQYKKVKADIAKQNDVLAKMSVKDIANNKELLNSVRLSINPQTGEVSYTNYTVNDPKGKPALTDLELAEKIKQKAKNKNFYVTEHIGKKSFNKANLAFPNNIQSANYMSNAQLENARRFLIIPENRNTAAAQNLDKTLESLKLTIRGPEYGDKPIGNKMNIVFDSKTGVSNIVEDQKIQAKVLRKMGFKCKFAGSNGGLGSCDDPASYIDDINKTQADINSDDPTVRNKAIVKNRKALEIAKTIPKIGKFVQKAAQVGASIITTPLKALGLTSPIGVAIEGAVEGGIYDYYRAQGYNHNQAYAETFTPKTVTDAAGITDTGVGALEGAQKLLDAEKFGAVQYDIEGNEIGIKTGNPKGLAKQYSDLYKNYEQEYNKYANIANSLDQIKSYGGPDLNNLEQQLKIQTANVNQAANAIKPGTPAYEAFQIAEENQAGRMDNRRREYLEKTRGTSEPSEFQNLKKEKERGKEMIEMFPMYTPEITDSMYKQANIKQPENFDYNYFNNMMRDQDKMDYFADNFRLEKASGGIASLTKTIPPASGPTPHGLPSLTKRGIKIKE